ncbi:hypothetical protein DFQ27_008260 [Actinomortierella ambigua]|uniref:Uncharacterized protein n=1 Tax=Actinomortierella ambigua TaxID=1343610 RepID=A0A9P6TYZ1_9FUNG|nr:hypothetical protein DFQ27_008260 [Actinomortierella ambigua]
MAESRGGDIGETLQQQQQQQQQVDPLAEYQEELQNVLEYVDQGMILKSIGLLGQLTERVVANIEPLGLASDDGPPARREGFWTGLNNCWLFALSHAQDTARWDDPTFSSLSFLSPSSFSSPSSPSPSSPFASQQQGPILQEQRHLVHLKHRVVDWANRLEPWGLVDYELGFWERDILEAIESCLVATNSAFPSSLSSPASSPPVSSPPSPSPSETVAPLATGAPVLDLDHQQSL